MHSRHMGFVCLELFTYYKVVNSIYSNRDDSIIQVTEWQVFRLFIVQLVQVLILILFPFPRGRNKFPFFFLFFEREEKNKRDTFFFTLPWPIDLLATGFFP